MYPVHVFEFVSTPAADALQLCAPGAISSCTFSSAGSCAAWHTGQGSHVVVTSWRPFESVSHAAEAETRTFVSGSAYMRSCLSDTATPIAGGAMCAFETTLSNWQSTSGMCSLSSPQVACHAKRPARAGRARERHRFPSIHLPSRARSHLDGNGRLRIGEVDAPVIGNAHAVAFNGHERVRETRRK